LGESEMKSCVQVFYKITLLTKTKFDDWRNGNEGG